MRRLLLPLAAALLLSVVPRAQQQEQPPRFRGGVELIQLDVAVLDRSRRPVTGLDKNDFTILENGAPRPIVAFEEVSAPDPDGSLVPWMREVAPDVRANTADGRRVFVLVLDDVTAAGGVDEQRVVETVKTIARTFVERMGPLDQACVVLTGDNRLAQDFTDDHRALLAVIEKFHGTTVPGFLRSLYPSSVVGQAAQSLIEISHRRKALIYIGSGLRIPEQEFAPIGMPTNSDVASSSQRRTAVEGAILNAQRANVTIYTINPHGLETFTDEAARLDSNEANDGLYTVANATGGFAVANTNSFTSQVGQIFSETGSYYLIGFESAHGDGKFRRVDVRVDRPGLNVRSRNGYVATKPEKPGKEAPPLFKALAGALPTADMYMRAAVAAFAAPERPGGTDRKAGAVAIVLGLSQPKQSERVSHDIDLAITVSTNEGKPVTNRRQTARVTVASGDEGDAKYEILSRVDVKPGRYILRFAMYNRTLGKSGSVYTQIDVPNFEKERLSMSGLAVSLEHGLHAAGKDILSGVIPLSPTTQRSFANDDAVSVFARVYQGAGKQPAPVSMKAAIRDAADKVVYQSTDPLAPAPAADFTLPLPTGRLAPGPYLLELEASTDARTSARRVLRFFVR